MPPGLHQLGFLFPSELDSNWMFKMTHFRRTPTLIPSLPLKKARSGHIEADRGSGLGATLGYRNNSHFFVPKIDVKRRGATYTRGMFFLILFKLPSFIITLFTAVRREWRKKTFLQAGTLMQISLRKSGRHNLKAVMRKSLMDFKIISMSGCQGWWWGGGWLLYNNDNDDTYMMPLRQFDLQSCSA